jgi:hypothetical protein
MVVLDGLNFAELEPLDYKPAIFRFEYIGAPEREFVDRFRDPRGEACRMWRVVRGSMQNFLQ